MTSHCALVVLSFIKPRYGYSLAGFFFGQKSVQSMSKRRIVRINDLFHPSISLPIQFYVAKPLKILGFYLFFLMSFEMRKKCFIMIPLSKISNKEHKCVQVSPQGNLINQKEAILCLPHLKMRFLH